MLACGMNVFAFVSCHLIFVSAAAYDSGGLLETAPALATAAGAQCCELLALPRIGSIVLNVSDSGAGLSQQQLAEICSEGVQFNANQLQAGQGSGLGLFISKGIIEQHGGKLTATSQGLNRGATIAVELPLFQQSATSQRIEAGNICSSLSQRMEPVSKASGYADREIELSTEHALARQQTQRLSKRILVVDDAASNRKMLLRLLAAKGYMCEQAEDGRQSIEVYQRMISESGAPPTAIIMDYEMPVMNGPTATRKLREMGCAIPIIGVTGNLLPEDVADFKLHGANEVMGKPLNIDQLQGFLERCKTVTNKSANGDDEWWDEKLDSD